MARPFSALGKQVLCSNTHYADAKDDHTAAKIAQSLNFCAIEDTDLEDELDEAIDDSLDMNWTARTGARAAVAKLKALATAL